MAKKTQKQEIKEIAVAPETLALSLEERVALYNKMVAEAAALIPEISGKNPVCRPQLVVADNIQANDYNPNKVAPPEMRLLALSMVKDGMTMPVVACPDEGDKMVVVDGFHRTTLAKTNSTIRDSLCGYVPVVTLEKNIEDRITSTVRHNIARGSHQVELSAKLVTALRKHNWTNERIGKELGMDPEEVLRMKQITGLAEAFKDDDFSNSWT
jgi:ParB-like chromosome segregation protein Spo0J